MSVEPVETDDSIVSGVCPRHALPGVDDRTIERTRYERAITAPRTIEPIAEHFVAIDGTDEYHHVDTEAGRCDCPDSQYRAETHCRHAVQAAIAEIVVRGVTSDFCARVAAAARRWGCPVDSTGCDGPLAPGEIGIPCPTCCGAPTAVRGDCIDEYDVWQAVGGGR